MLRGATFVAWASLVLVLPLPAEALRLSGFASDLPGAEADDAVELHNDEGAPVDLVGVAIEDGEGRLEFDAGTLPPGGRVRIAGNATAYRVAARADPDYALGPPGPWGTVRESGRGFRLAQAGDEILVKNAGALEDVVCYGDCRYQGPGWSGPPLDTGGGLSLRWFARLDAASDTDTRADWESPKRQLLGRTQFRFEPVHHEGSATAFVAPDRSREVVLGLVDRAESRLWINAYEFRDAELARRLAARLEARPGFDLRLLLDESPVGRDAEDRGVAAGIAELLESAGASVRLLRHDRYAYDHAKYAVADGRFVLVMTENWVGTGIPTDRSRGNRGWGLLLDDPELAGQLESVFEADFAEDAFGARPRTPEDGAPLPLPAAPTDVRGTAAFGTQDASAFPARLMIVPEQTLTSEDLVLNSLARAQTEILVVQLNAPPQWIDRTGKAWPSQYVEALAEAAQRGVRVRVLLDGHFVDATDQKADNLDTAAYLASRSPAAPRLEVRLMEADDRVLHAKGLVVDGREVVLGSMNWNLNSLAENREVNVWAESPALASFFASVFEADWAQAEGRGVEAEDDVPALPLLATVITLTLLPALTMRRRRPPR